MRPRALCAFCSHGNLDTTDLPPSLYARRRIY